MPEAQRGETVLVVAGHALDTPVGRDLAVEPRDAARTEQLLQELIASGRLKDW